MGKIKRIPINIWDDYYEDDYIPKIEIRERTAYSDKTEEIVISVRY